MIINSRNLLFLLGEDTLGRRSGKGKREQWRESGSDKPGRAGVMAVGLAATEVICNDDPKISILFFLLTDTNF
jgi:hypothetical protein